MPAAQAEPVSDLAAPPLATSLLGVAARRQMGDDSKASDAYRRIKDLIVSLELPPAAMLDEAGLAQRLGLGLTPVRQALRRLAWENLVVIMPRRGTMVADLNPSDLSKIFELRVELEGLACALAAERISAAQRLQLDGVVKRTEAALADPATSHRRLIELDREMHFLLYASANNELLEQTLEWLYTHVLRLWNIALERVGELPAAILDHLAIAEAVSRGDGAAASERMRDHVRHFQQAYQRTL